VKVKSSWVSSVVVSSLLLRFELGRVGCGVGSDVLVSDRVGSEVNDDDAGVGVGGVRGSGLLRLLVFGGSLGSDDGFRVVGRSGRSVGSCGDSVGTSCGESVG
jgi:hypothetical protein